MTAYQSARDLFEAARDASRDAEYIKRRIMRMQEAEGARGASLTPSVSHPLGDVMARTDARMDYEARVSGRLEEDYALVDLACAVLYGDDNRGGVAALLGTRVADLLWHHYLDGESWDEAARVVGMPRTTAFREKDKALDLVDMYGVDLVRRGQGAAT